MAVEDAPSYADPQQRLAQAERELAAALAREAATSDILRVIAASTTELQAVLDAVAEKAARLCGAADGAAYRVRGDVLWAESHYGSVPLAVEPVAISRGTYAGRSVVERRTIHIHDLAAVRKTEFQESPASLSIRTVLIAPLLREGVPIGTISLRRTEVQPFTDRQVALLETFADQAVIAIENTRWFGELRDRTAELDELNRTLEARVGQQLEELERVGRLRRYLAPQVADLIVSSGDESILASHRRQITVVFCDLRGFTAFAEIAEPEEVMGVLSEYHAALGELIHAYAGTIEYFAGDGLMVFFNDPLPQPDHAERAVRMACAMRERVDGLAHRWRRQGHELGFGVGIALGYATLGHIGFEGRLDYAAIGTVSNLAARLCGEAADGQILISGRVLGVVDDLVQTEHLGELMLKGFHRPVEAFNVVGVGETGSTPPDSSTGQAARDG